MKKTLLTLALICSAMMNFKVTAATVKFKRPLSWHSAYIYAWYEEKDNATGEFVVREVTKSWPGNEMQLYKMDENYNLWYSYTFPDDRPLGYAFILNNQGSPQSRDLSTISLHYGEDACYIWTPEKEDISFMELRDENCDGEPDYVALENVDANTVSSVYKVLENGTIYIVRDGTKYMIDGRRVE